MSKLPQLLYQSFDTNDTKMKAFIHSQAALFLLLCMAAMASVPNSTPFFETSECKEQAAGIPEDSNSYTQIPPVGEKVGAYANARRMALQAKQKAGV